jgi:hypothetical protein
MNEFNPAKVPTIFHALLTASTIKNLFFLLASLLYRKRKLFGLSGRRGRGPKSLLSPTIMKYFIIVNLCNTQQIGVALCWER